MSRWTTTTTLVVACWLVIGCSEHTMREGPTGLFLVFWDAQLT